LDKESIFSDWRSDAKAYLEAKGCFFYCTTNFGGQGHTELERDKSAGILWSMLSKSVKPLIKQHEDDPKALWEALELIFAPRKAGAHFNAYRTLTSIKLKEDESLLSLTGCVSTAMNSLKHSRPKGFNIDQADAELQAVVLLIALPDESGYNSLKAPFEMSTSTLSPSEVETAYANFQVFKTAGHMSRLGMSWAVYCKKV
jgi:hypothetical protein